MLDMIFSRVMIPKELGETSVRWRILHEGRTADSNRTGTRNSQDPLGTRAVQRTRGPYGVARRDRRGHGLQHCANVVADHGRQEAGIISRNGTHLYLHVAIQS